MHEEFTENDHGKLWEQTICDIERTKATEGNMQEVLHSVVNRQSTTAVVSRACCMPEAHASGVSFGGDYQTLGLEMPVQMPNGTSTGTIGKKRLC